MSNNSSTIDFNKNIIYRLLADVRVYKHNLSRVSGRLDVTIVDTSGNYKGMIPHQCRKVTK